ncbi:hypothetical protein [Aquabacterium sp. OR-4]|uniref:hypothetical protein n=1 Tax=Aquabacterium sp. OR-4 TaxID=2978127 RepID=UPI0021B1A977|nr:hypothetical protein [Aquabacterium sp. OR-4]MDT7834995.1 hypothetical protein [Aquabacterium sp. OR-4]
MIDDNALKQPAATITAALIARLPADQEVTPAQAAALFHEVLAAVKVLPGILPPAPKAGVF